MQVTTYAMEHGQSKNNSVLPDDMRKEILRKIYETKFKNGKLAIRNNYKY